MFPVAATYDLIFLSLTLEKIGENKSSKHDNITEISLSIIKNSVFTMVSYT